ncbi:MAG: two-component system cell cycle sensor histidine kinase [Beijerinckiaceae bacterium]|nr:MAG: two-component system cell cycle sensor histidine kinase [Beijerinckiaceae bacterium]
MVRAFAASAIRLRGDKHSTRANFEPAALAAPGRTILDWAVPVLVLIFLAVSGLSIALQFTITRNEQLAASESNLALAAHLVATEITRTTRDAQDENYELPPLPADVFQPGRRFLLVDTKAVIRGGQAGQQDVSRPAGMLLADPSLMPELVRSETLLRVKMANGELASAIARQPAGFNGTLIAFQPIEDELLTWRRHAQIIGAILACFGAVTLMFTLVYYAQRQRTVTAGTNARQIRSQFEVALDHGRCGLWDWSLAASALVWSDSMYRMLDLTGRGGLSRKEIEARLHPDDRDLFARIEQGARTGDCEFDYLFRMLHQNNSWVWLRMRAVIDNAVETASPRLLGIVMDVTRERVAEEESHRADARLRDAIESISEAFVLWDENNRLVMCNSKYQSFHGLDTELAHRGATYKSLMAEAHQPRVLIEIDRGSEPESGARSYEAQFQDGRWLLISERHTRDGGYVSVGTDITGRKLQEERLVENERQLRMTVTDLGNSREAFRRQAGQLAELADRYLEQKAEAISANRAKAEFLANMNHEIRTPLNHIIGFSEMIETQVFGPCASPRYVEYARDIRESGTNLLILISDILDMARIEAGRVALERAPTPLGALLEAATTEVRDAAEAKGIELEIEPDLTDKAAQRLIHVDAAAIGQALAHLLRNGIRLSPVGGRVSVRARMSGDHVNIFVADKGCTLSPGDLGKMVDPFGHIDGMLQDGCKGSGLGVSIARSLIELHGGTIRLRSSPEIGSLIMIHLPVSLQPMQLDLPMNA